MMMDSTIFLDISHLNKHVISGDSEIIILRDVNLTVKAGESIAILGASGSGKTTLLTLLAGLDLPSAGSISFLGQSLEKLNEEERACVRGRNIGFIFQSFLLLPTLTALENVMLPLEIQYISSAVAKQKAQDWLQRVGLASRLQHYPNKLSGGEQQRVAIARAFVTNPTIIFADEMTGNLDLTTGKLVSDILFSLNKELNTTLILVTHDNELANRCDRQLLLHDGVLQAC
jgi:putative ABC transport system ATP-binding protein